MIIRKKNLLYITSGTPVPPTPPGPTPSGHALLYIQAGINFNSRTHLYCIDTGIHWTPLYWTYGGLSVELKYSEYYTAGGGLIAGCKPKRNGQRYMYAFWRFFTHGNTNICLDAPSEDDRITISNFNKSNKVFTTLQTIQPGSVTANTYLKVTQEDTGDIREGSKTNTSYGVEDSGLVNPTLGLFRDPQSVERGDTDSSLICTSGTKVYYYRIWGGPNKDTLLWDGQPWMDGNGVPCMVDLVSGNLYYNIASDQNFLYEEIQ